MLGKKELDDLARRGFALETIEIGKSKQLALRDLENPQLSPLSVDFLSVAMKQRFKTGTSKNEPLAKALGLRSFDGEPHVIDATAGLGTDAFIMSGMGCEVRAIERSPAIHALLEDGLARLKAGVWAEPWISTARRLYFERGDAIELLASTEADMVYLDPMFPDESHSKSALPKRTMQIFRRLLDGDEDSEKLFEAAMQAARSRVVVKRPPQAPPLAGNPTHQLEGKTARFDVYVVTR
ncbi:MAG: class I SAM-dependent methyltransferase [Bdellovibrionota bacterium]